MQSSLRLSLRHSFGSALQDSLREMQYADVFYLGGQKNQFHILRVREIFFYLRLAAEREKVKLPLRLFCEKFETITYPKNIVKNKLFSQFGLFLEELTAKCFLELYDKKFQAENPTFRSDLSEESIQQKMCFLGLEEVDICGFQKTHLQRYFLENYHPTLIKKIVWEYEFLTPTNTERLLGLAGHPDFTIFLPNREVVIFDSKVFAFLTIGEIKRKAIKYQLSCYVALARLSGYKCNKVGVILPWRHAKSVVTYDVSKWDEKPFVALFDCACQKTIDSVIHEEVWTSLLYNFNVGSHIEKTHALEIIQKKMIVSKPFQIFLYGNQPSGKLENKGREVLLKKKLDFQYYKAFVHAPYNLNLAKTEDYIMPSCEMYVKDCAAMNFKGVVFHCGHDVDQKRGYATMKDTITRLLPNISSTCPFLLETPCGTKTELLGHVEEFAKFILEFPEEKVGICVDTCHVFVSGYDPLEYIASLTSLGVEKRIKLVHFNGSRKCKGSHVDGHQHVTTLQEIPTEELLGILEFAKQSNIPCVTE